MGRCARGEDAHGRSPAGRAALEALEALGDLEAAEVREAAETARAAEGTARGGPAGPHARVGEVGRCSRRLRQLAVVRGLGSAHARSRAWPRLLGLGGSVGGGDWGGDGGGFSPEVFAAWAAGEHRESAVVQVDVERSLWGLTPGWDEDRREARRAGLRRVLDAVVVEGRGDVHYYQGLHDVASVLLLNCGEFPAFAMLRRLVRHQLQDCAGPSLEPVLKSLELLLPIVKAADKEVGAFLERSGVGGSHFAVSWRLTWFSHTAAGLPAASRLFDLFLATHPLMPLYIGAAAIVAQREAVLALEPEMPLVHQHLSRMDVCLAAPVGQLARQAVALYKAHAPDRLAAQARIPRALVPLLGARLGDCGAWVVGGGELQVRGAPGSGLLQWWRGVVAGAAGSGARGGAISLAALALIAFSRVVEMGLQEGSLPAT